MRRVVSSFLLSSIVVPLGVLFGLFVLPQAAGAQSSPTIAGVVTDHSGGVLVGAVVTCRQGETVREAVTDATGRFQCDRLAAGEATLTVHFPAFQVVTRSVVPSAAELQFVLSPDGVSETVNVGARLAAERRVLSATRTDTPLRDVPQAVSVVSQQLIADQRMQGMADVVRYMPGVGIAQGEGNRDTPVLRGNSTTADFFVDGVRDDAQYFRDLYNVERVEALKGPNAMIFGRGGVGGVINRVSRQADWGATREVALQLGSWNDRRLTTDLGGALNDRVAGRVTAMYQGADSYRSGVSLERAGVNPTVAFRLGAETTLRASYEYFQDQRTADRGISSFNGRPVTTAASTFFGDPDQSTSDARVHLASVVAEHRTGAGFVVRSRVTAGAYDKFYQNVFPGAVNAAGTQVSISAYNNQTDRQNVFSQTDVIAAARTGALAHALLVGTEFGRQATTNVRETGYFSTLGPNVTSVSRPLDAPRSSLPLTFRQSASDADNNGVATIAALYAQDQVSLTRHLQAIVGLRVDRFHVDFRNNRTGGSLANTDLLFSPRAGVVVKPMTALSLYGNYSLAYQPRAGEQLASLSVTNQALAPEQFTNLEAGVKWDVTPALAFTGALYRLDRSNVAVPDPLDATRSILVDAQRASGVELELAGSLAPWWQVSGGYAYQDGQLTQTVSPTARAGARLAMLPAHSWSMWNKVTLPRQWEAALGVVHRGPSFTSLDNTVTLPGFTRLDGALFYDITRRVRAQLNAENLLDRTYFASAHNNTNITPGAPRTLRLTLNVRF